LACDAHLTEPKGLNGIYGVNDGPHVAEGKRPSDMTPGGIPFHPRSMVRNEGTAVASLFVSFHGLQHIHIAFVDEDLRIPRDRAPDRSKMDKKNLVQVAKVTDLLQHINAHFSEGTLAECDPTGPARNLL